MTEMTFSKKFIRFYEKAEIIFEENSLGDEMYVITSGKVKLTTNGRDVRSF